MCKSTRRGEGHGHRQRQHRFEAAVAAKRPGHRDGDTALTGTLTVTLYPSSDCTGTAVPGQSYTTTFAGASSPQNFNTSNTTFFVGTKPDGTAGATAGAYSWKVHYDDTILNDPADQCETSTVSITDAP